MNVTRLFIAVLAAGILGAGVTLAVGQGVSGGPPATSAQPSTNRPPPPVRDPRTPGYVTATNATELPDGAVPPVDAYGNYILGPTHPPAPETTAQDGVPRGIVHTFTMNSADSKIYPGIARTPGSRPTVDPTDPAKRIVSSGPAPYTRSVAVYVPRQYVPGHRRSLDRRGRWTRSAVVHDAGQSDRTEARARDDRDLHRQWQWRRAGQSARPRIRHDVGALRAVRRNRGAAARRKAIRREADQESRCARHHGLQLRGSAALAMAWYQDRSLPSRTDVLRHVT